MPQQSASHPPPTLLISLRLLLSKQFSDMCSLMPSLRFFLALSLSGFTFSRSCQLVHLHRPIASALPVRAMACRCSLAQSHTSHM